MRELSDEEKRLFHAAIDRADSYGIELIIIDQYDIDLIIIQQRRYESLVKNNPSNRRKE